MANASFIFSDGQNNTMGKATITKSDTVTVSITEPDIYKGITVKSDNTGNPDVFSFEFSGIPASVPKSITSDLSLMFSLFSDDIPNRISSLDKGAFKTSELVNDNGDELIEVFFLGNNMSYSITYDKHSGTPYSFDAGNDELSVNIILSDFKITRTQ